MNRLDIATLQTGPIGTNTYIIPLLPSQEDGAMLPAVVVDPACSALSRDESVVSDYLKDHNLVPCMVFLTHGHFDHILGIPSLVKAFGDGGRQNGGLKAVVSKKDALALQDETLSFHSLSLEMMNDGGGGPLSKALHEVIECVQGRVAAFDDENTLGEVCVVADGLQGALDKWRIIAAPGHTAGSVCLYNPNDDGKGNGGAGKASGRRHGYLLSGDTVFYHGWGRTDLGGSERQIMSSLKMLKNTIPPSTLVFPGHDSYGFLFEDAL